MLVHVRSSSVPAGSRSNKSLCQFNLCSIYGFTAEFGRDLILTLGYGAFDVVRVPAFWT